MKFKKYVALLLTASLMSSVAGCSKLFDDSMVSIAEKVCKGISDDNYDKVEGYLDGKNKKLESAMDLETDDEDIKDAIEIIFSTVSYEVDEDSLESDFFGREGSIDVNFSIVDYESILKEQDVFRSIDEFDEAVEDCDDTIDTSITLEFSKSGVDTVITNGDDLADLFDFKDIQITVLGTLGEHLTDDRYFDGDEYDPSTNTYTDCNDLRLVYKLDETGTENEWIYSYSVDWEGTNDYNSGELTKRAGSDEIVLQYYVAFPEGYYIYDGTYDFRLYDETGEEIAVLSCYVTHNEPEPEPEPEPDLIDLPYYVDINTAPVILTCNDYQVTIPLGLSVLPQSDPLVQQTAESDLGQRTCAYMTDFFGHEFVFLYLDAFYFDAINSNMSGIIDAFNGGMPANYVVEENYSETRTVADQTVDLYIIKVTTGYSELYYGIFMLDGGDHGYMVTACCGSLDELYSYCDCISVI